MIVAFADALYEKKTGLDIFNIMRANQRLCDVAIRVHFRALNTGRQEMMARMSRHEQCYINHRRQVQQRVEAGCQVKFEGEGEFQLLHLCPKGHVQLLCVDTSKTVCEGLETLPWETSQFGYPVFSWPW